MAKFKKGEVIKLNGNHYVIVGKDQNDYVDAFNLDGFYLDNVYSYDASKSKRKPFTITKAQIDSFDGTFLSNGKKTIGVVGCRVFDRVKDARQHWANDETGDHWEEVSQGDVDRANANKKRLKGFEKNFAKVQEKHNG